LLEAEATLHETRERMQFALESVGVGFWEWDMRSDKVVWSEVQERLHGVQPRTFGGTFEAFIAAVHADDREEMLRWGHAEQARPGAGDFRVEYRTRWPDGSVHWILSIGRMRGGEGTSVDAAGVSLDITAQKSLEDQVRQAQKMESVGNLAGGIAHDFNNLLTVISGCCDLAAPALAPGSEAAESLDGIRSAAASASALTRQLLMFSRRQIVTPRLLNLNETITGFRPILRRLVEEDVQIDFDLACSPHLVSIDPGQIEQVLLNLVANARDAMPSGGTLTIGTSDVSPHDEGGRPSDIGAGAYVLLSVADTGSGMSQEVQSHVFEPFFTTKPIGQGTGLGLATVYGIVKQSEGHIGVRSAPGSGTTFSLYLPVVCAPRESPPAEETKDAVGLTGAETILVVEDNAPLRRLAAKMLERHGYTVLVAADGAEAQQICVEHQGPIPVVLMDVVMPGENGPTVGEWIRQRRPDTKIIYTSGYTGYATDYGRVSRPGDVFLSKPFSATRLARAVRDVLASQDDADARSAV
jgi:signal transduction histidine kinase/ActR/RegA family two-component response regulator